MQALFNSTYPILIQGETGTGKTNLAKEIHYRSQFQNKDYIHCNLAGLSDGLFESELFGHLKGAFTGACSDKIGFCEMANGGTLFFDEIGDITLAQQKKLLQLLDSGEFYSVGGTLKKKFIGRFIFATHRSLELLVRRGEFREDLYFRLGGAAISLKPIREKSESERVSALRKIIKEAKEKYELKEKYFCEEAFDVLLSYSWPGNYREMKTSIELILLKSPRMKISKGEIPSKFVLEKNEGGRFKSQVAELEKKILYNEVVNKGVGITKASKSLGISKTTLIAKLRKYGISGQSLERVEKSVA
ncbi:sigma 54-interacting transcriptional regulator [Halobacteriovorax sp. JY17]|uniref:sigma-54-dependent transcriptional regulator n=1 Tax=Halobacteriovorax sp. JY17 TaxID=2014617 RepID=UPI0025BB9F6D|nr:sigma 54-interacting transcriptional regulator [Halobacteriovorax sp. JY17]